MISALPLSTLAKTALPNKVLSGGLLPLNNNQAFISTSGIFSVAIVDTDGKTPVAFGALNKYSGSQAYCMLGEVAEKYKRHTVWVECIDDTEKNSHVYKITKSVDHPIDRSGEPNFQSVFANHHGRSVHLHMVDALIKGTIGVFNLDVNKNITVDLVKDEEQFDNAKTWRDESGFVVSDRFQFEQLTVNRFELLALSQDNDSITVENMGKDNVISALDFDGELTVFNRSEFLTSLMQIDGMIGKLAKKNGVVTGYALALNDRIINCYGEDDEVVCNLLASLGSQMTAPEVSLFVRNDSGTASEKLSQNALKKEIVERYHTRANINGVKWNYVACPNMGLSIF